jgi:hypothetical protein
VGDCGAIARVPLARLRSESTSASVVEIAGADCRVLRGVVVSVEIETAGEVDCADGSALPAPKYAMSINVSSGKVVKEKWERCRIASMDIRLAYPIIFMISHPVTNGQPSTVPH